MSKLNELGRLLNGDHRRITLVMSALEERILGREKNHLIDPFADPGRQQLQRLIETIDHDVTRHFRFEEEALFPMIEKAGYGRAVQFFLCPGV